MKCAILTIFDNTNFGNRLQNFAVHKVLTEQIKVKNVETVIIKKTNKKGKLLGKLKDISDFPLIDRCKTVVRKTLRGKEDDLIHKRYVRFTDFTNSYIPHKKYYITNQEQLSALKSNYDFFVVGSDQIWNPEIGYGRDIDFAYFADSKQIICFSPSFGIETIPDDKKPEFKKYLSHLRNISVREDTGAEIVKKLAEKDAELLIDPTMMLDAHEWLEIAKKPKREISKPYVFKYFLNSPSNSTENKISKIAEDGNLEIVDILNSEDSKIYVSGPGEFVYLIANADIVCTDSFHACVFSIIFDKPFLVFPREGKYINMNSRISTLLEKFEINDRSVGSLKDEELFKHDYQKAFEILNFERNKVREFLLKSIEV